MKQLAHMAGMVGDRELLFDQPGDHRGGPDAAVQAVGHRAGVQDIAELLTLESAEFGRAAGALAFEQAFDAELLIMGQPLGDLRAGCFEDGGDIAAGAAFGVEHDGLQPFGDAIGAVAFGFLGETDQALKGTRMEM
jgi:hypothetical protein